MNELKICALIWWTGTVGIPFAQAQDLAKDAPTKSDPLRPGPFVYATASISFGLMCIFKGKGNCWNNITLMSS